MRPVAIRATLLALLVPAALVPVAAGAQAADGVAAPAPAGADGVYLTVFRSPATGIELRRARLAVHAGHYPTILRADGQDDGENTNFVRVGGSAYLRRTGWSPYVSPAFLLSLDDDWRSGVLTEAGMRVPVRGRAAVRLGLAVLTSFGGEARVNPTVGADVRLGRGR